MDKYWLKTGVGQANLRKREKTNGLVGLKTGGRMGNLREKENMNG